MSTSDSSKGDKFRPIFPHHDQKRSRAERWRDFVTNLQSYMGTKTPILAEHILSDSFDEDEVNCGQTDDFFQYTLGVTSTSSEKTLKAAQEKYLQAQYELFLCLTHNFQTTDRATIDRNKQQAVVARIMKQNPSVTANDLWVRFVPFASLCHIELASKYEDQGATDALIKLHNFQIAKPFKPNNVSAWISVVENTWSQVADIADDPAYLAALELLLSVKNSKHEVWSPWAANFAHEHRDKPFIVDELLSQVRAKNNLEQASSSTSQVVATVSYASDQGKGYRSPKINQGGKRRKVCAWDGCQRQTTYTYCQNHYRKTKPKDHSGVSPAARAKIDTSSLEKAKRNMLKSQERYKALRDAKKSANADAHAAEANTAALVAATEYEHDESVPDESEHVIISRKRKRASATSAAQTAKPKKKKLLGKLKVMTDSQATAKKKTKKKRSTAEALIACSDDFFDNMTISQFDRS